jgi:hypothetical protein
MASPVVRCMSPHEPALSEDQRHVAASRHMRLMSMSRTRWTPAFDPGTLSSPKRRSPHPQGCTSLRTADDSGSPSPT